MVPVLISQTERIDNQRQILTITINNLLLPSDTIRLHNLVSIGSDNDLLRDSTKRLPEPMQTN